MLTYILEAQKYSGGKVGWSCQGRSSWKHECHQVHQPGGVFHSLEHLEEIAAVPVIESLGFRYAHRHTWRGWDTVGVGSHFLALPESLLHRWTSPSALWPLDISFSQPSISPQSAGCFTVSSVYKTDILVLTVGGNKSLWSSGEPRWGSPYLG